MSASWPCGGVDEGCLDERRPRLVAASETWSAGRGGVLASGGWRKRRSVAGCMIVDLASVGTRRRNETRNCSATAESSISLVRAVDESGLPVFGVAGTDLAVCAASAARS
jgi:hypothetical protein